MPDRSEFDGHPPERLRGDFEGPAVAAGAAVDVSYAGADFVGTGGEVGGGAGAPDDVAALIHLDGEWAAVHFEADLANGRIAPSAGLDGDSA